MDTRIFKRLGISNVYSYQIDHLDTLVILKDFKLTEFTLFGKIIHMMHLKSWLYKFIDSKILVLLKNTKLKKKVGGGKVTSSFFKTN